MACGSDEIKPVHVELDPHCLDLESKFCETKPIGDGYTRYKTKTRPPKKVLKKKVLRKVKTNARKSTSKI